MATSFNQSQCQQFQSATTPTSSFWHLQQQQMMQHTEAFPSIVPNINGQSPSFHPEQREAYPSNQQQPGTLTGVMIPLQDFQQTTVASTATNVPASHCCEVETEDTLCCKVETEAPGVVNCSSNPSESSPIIQTGGFGHDPFFDLNGANMSDITDTDVAAKQADECYLLTQQFFDDDVSSISSRLAAGDWLQEHIDSPAFSLLAGFKDDEATSKSN